MNAGEPSTTILVSDAIEKTGDAGIYIYGDGCAKTQIRLNIMVEDGIGAISSDGNDAAIAEGKRQIRDMFWKILPRYPTLR